MSRLQPISPLIPFLLILYIISGCSSSYTIAEENINRTGKDNRKIGKWIEYIEKDSLKISLYNKKGNLRGREILVWDFGRRFTVTHYINGKKNGWQKYYYDRRLVMSVKYRNDKVIEGPNLRYK